MQSTQNKTLNTRGTRNGSNTVRSNSNRSDNLQDTRNNRSQKEYIDEDGFRTKGSRNRTTSSRTTSSRTTRFQEDEDGFRTKGPRKRYNRNDDKTTSSKDESFSSFKGKKPQKSGITKKLMLCKENLAKKFGFKVECPKDISYCGFADSISDQVESDEYSEIYDMIRDGQNGNSQAFSRFRIYGKRNEFNFKKLKRLSQFCNRFLQCQEKFKKRSKDFEIKNLCTGGINCKGGICGDCPNYDFSQSFLIDFQDMMTGESSGQGIQLTQFGLIPFEEQKKIVTEKRKAFEEKKSKEEAEEQAKLACSYFTNNAPSLSEVYGNKSTDKVSIECSKEDSSLTKDLGSSKKPLNSSNVWSSLQEDDDDEEEEEKVVVVETKNVWGRKKNWVDINKKLDEEERKPREETVCYKNKTYTCVLNYQESIKLFSDVPKVVKLVGGVYQVVSEIVLKENLVEEETEEAPELEKTEEEYPELVLKEPIELKLKETEEEYDEENEDDDYDENYDDFYYDLDEF